MLPVTHSCKIGLNGNPLKSSPRSCLLPTRRAAISTQALFGKKAASKKEEPKKEKDWRGGILSALDFAETRSQDDARLLTSARGKKKGERMTDDEAKALRRKVGGTANNYFKEWVDVKGAYAEKGYVSKGELPPALPFLLVVVLGLVGAAVYATSQTNAPAALTGSSSPTEQSRTLTREQREEYGMR